MNLRGQEGGGRKTPARAASAPGQTVFRRLHLSMSQRSLWLVINLGTVWDAAAVVNFSDVTGGLRLPAV